MESYLRAIGFSNFDEDELQDLRDYVFKNADKRFTLGRRKMRMECHKNVGPGLNLRLMGILTENGKKMTESALFPGASADKDLFLREFVSDFGDNTPEVSITYEDINSNNELKFVLQNPLEYRNSPFEKYLNYKSELKRINIAALSTNATILLPVHKDDAANKEKQVHSNLVLKAKKDTPGAKEDLLMYEDNSLRIIHERLKDEDLLTVVDSYILPIDNEPHIYDILGTIGRIATVQNSMTGEYIYKIDVDAAGVKIQIFINKYDILGIPIVNMRFMGKCMLQGVLKL